jgi:uncharacterized membrane protein
MGFLHPELLLLALPATWLWWSTRGHGRVTALLRALVAALVVIALAGPYLEAGGDGRDLVIVVDRSRSMPAEAGASALELIQLAAQEREPEDRVYVIGFGADVEIEHATLTDERFQGFEADVAPDGSDVAAALEAALGILQRGRRGSILLLSDGEANGRDPQDVARRAYARGVRIDARAFTRPDVADLSVERIELPGEVAVGEPFQFQVWVRADRRVETEFHMQRGERVLSSGTRVFEAGLNRVLFRDVLERTGIAEYDVLLGGTNDRVPENNHGVGAVLASGAPAVLILNHDGSLSPLASALRQARIPTVVSTPEAARLDLVGLSPFRGVVLENVAADRVGGRGMRALRDFVRDRGGGLLMTGGGASFGRGGYYLSAVEEVLPVTMEMRQEHRKHAIAMAIALDRSGSMSVAVGGGLAKMDLANLGTNEALKLLSPMDSIAVIAVDSAPHVVQRLVAAADHGAISSRVLRIESMGGGIFVHTALVAALKELKKAKQLNKHIILFSDAADSEEQEGCFELIEEARRAGVSLSVVALGTQQDSDATFLIELAKRGGGDSYFTTEADQLPRLFALDTMTVARSTFVEEPTGVETLPDFFGVGALPTTDFPVLEGYNLCYLRPTAQAGSVTRDEYRAPMFSFVQNGLGRGAAYAGQIGGTHGQNVVAWPDFSAYFVTVGRWLVGQEEPEEFFASVRREGREAVLTVEVDVDAPLPPDTADLAAVITAADGARRELVLERTGAATYEARYPLDRAGVAVGTVALGGERFVSLPPIVLPYSPEFERSPDPERGERLLARLARETGGEVGVSAGRFFRGERGGTLWRVVTRELMLAALVLLLVEIAGRRLHLWGGVPIPAPVRAAGVRVQTATRALARRLATRRRRAPREVPSEPPASPAEAQVPPPEPIPRSAGSVGSALSRARKAADRKLDR